MMTMFLGNRVVPSPDNYSTSLLPKMKLWDQGQMFFLTSSFIHRICNCFFINLTKSFGSGWYVITRGIPFVSVLLSLEVSRNLTLLTSVSINISSLPSLQKPRFHFVPMPNRVTFRGAYRTNSQSLAIN